MVTFTYLGNTIQLRDPQLGNRRIVKLRTTIKRAMSGRVWAYANTPGLITLNLNFNHENRPKILEMIDFVRVSAGQFISYTDHNGLVWTGKIISQTFEETHVGRVNNEFQIEFEGTHV